MTFDAGYLDFQRQAELTGTPPDVCALHSVPKRACHHLPHRDPRGAESKNFSRTRPSVDLVNHPPHYTAHVSGLECIEITRGMTFSLGSAVKYIWRSELKNGRQDLEKAAFYLKDAIRHADPIFLPSRARETQRLLDVVIDAETDPHRIEFFSAIRYGARISALRAVKAML